MLMADEVNGVLRAQRNRKRNLKMISKNFWTEVSDEEESLMNELKELTELNSEFREEKEGLESEIEEFEFEMRKEKTL